MTRMFRMASSLGTSWSQNFVLFSSVLVTLCLTASVAEAHTFTDQVFSHACIVWFASLSVGVISGSWLIWDMIRLRRYWPKRAMEHDQVFGCVIGIMISTIGVAGVVYYYATVC